MVTGKPLSVDDDLQEYARRLSELHDMQRQAGEAVMLFEEGANRESMRLAHERARHAAQIRAELARWGAVNFAMPAASVPLVDAGTGGR